MYRQRQIGASAVTYGRLNGHLILNFINFFPVSNSDDKDDESIVLNFTNDSVVSNSVTPQSCFIFKEALSKKRGFVNSHNAKTQIAQDFLLNR